MDADILRYVGDVFIPGHAESYKFDFLSKVQTGEWVTLFANRLSLLLPPLVVVV